MIDIDELEKQANLATGDTPVNVHRDDLLFLIGRYRELPDETPEEAFQSDGIPGLRPEAGERSAEEWMLQARVCQRELRKAKRHIKENRYGFSLFADCPVCHAGPGKDCRVTPHEERLTAAFNALRRLRGSSYGETT